MNQLYVGKMPDGYWVVSSLSANLNSKFYVTVKDKKPICIPFAGLISTLLKPEPIYFPETQLVFQENANPPIPADERVAITDLVQSKIAEETTKRKMTADISAMFSNVDGCAKAVESIARQYLK